MIDLHTHSTCSDGTDPPQTIALLAHEAGLRAYALTDHDTLEGIPATKEAAASLGIEVVVGCELSTVFRKTSAHVLCYYVDEEDSQFNTELAKLKRDRVQRNKAVAHRLRELGIPISYDDMVKEATSETSVGRPHIATLLVKSGAAASIPDAFAQWLGQGKPAYIPKSRMSPRDVVAMANDAHAVTSLAHPLSLGLTSTTLLAALRELKDAGCTGMETYYANYSPEDRNELLRLSELVDLVPTGGSDYHGTMKPGLQVGIGRGDLEVPDETLQLLANRRA